MSRVKVINLERSSDRRTEFARRNPGLDFEFVKAVEGAALPPETLNDSGLFKPGLRYTVGAYGLALSHHRLWAEAIAANQCLTVAEDDAVFHPDFAAHRDAILARLPGDWDIVLWGWNVDSILSVRLPSGLTTVMGFDHAQTQAAVEAFPASRITPSALRLNIAFGTAGYTISPAGAAKFTAKCFPLADFTRRVPLLPQPIRNIGIDVAMNTVYPVSNAYVSFPPLMMTKNDRAASTIQTGQPVNR